MAVLSERVMAHLEAHGPCYTRQLAAALEATSSGIYVVCRCLRRHGLVCTEEGLHWLSTAGRELLASGGWVPCQRSGRAASSGGRTLRQRAWSVLHMVNTSTVGDLLRTLCDGTERGAEENLRNYCKALHRAGILGRTVRTGAYFLRRERYTGPLAPSYNREAKTVTDRNTGAVYALEGGHHA